jgi:predicted membrane-bound dolichyl-phosphate-mannose-protein mannosyltransferase
LGVAFFAMNPIVLIESLVSGHIDIVMVFFSIVSFYFLISKKYIFAFLFLLLSIGTKYATVFLFPIYLAIVTMQYMKEKIPWRMFMVTAIICLFISVIAASQESGNFQPWYLLTLIPFAAMIGESFYVILPVSIITFAALLTYLPFLYTGNWNNPIPMILSYIEIGGLITAILVTSIFALLRQKSSLFMVKMFSGLSKNENKTK